MLNYDGTLGTLGLKGEQNGLSSMYVGVFFGFVGLHWRLLSQPLQVFMGAAGGVLAVGRHISDDSLSIYEIPT